MILASKSAIRSALTAAAARVDELTTSVGALLGTVQSESIKRQLHDVGYDDERNRRMTRCIRPATRILDVSAGNQSVGKYLPTVLECDAFGLVSCDQPIRIWDFNRDPLPPQKMRADYVLARGCLEYAERPLELLRSLSALGDELLISYAPVQGFASRFSRSAHGWISALTRSQLEDSLRALGLAFEALGSCGPHRIYRASRGTLAPLTAKTRRALQAPIRRATICGSFGFANAGDEAVHLALCDLARNLDIDVGFDLLSRYRSPALREITGLDPRYRALRRAMTGTFVYVGGGVVEPNGQCVLLATEHVLREMSPKRFALLGVNAEYGVEYSGADRDRLARLLDQAAYVSARDELSAEVLRNLCPGRSIDVTGDVVLWLEPAATVAREVRDQGDFIAVTLSPRWSKEPGWHAWIAAELVAVARRLKMGLVFVPCSALYDDDRVEHAAVAQAIAVQDSKVRVHCLNRQLDPREALAIYGAARITIGMRLHACVMSYNRKVPCVGLGYHPKLLGFARTIGADRFFLPQVIPQKQREGEYGFSFEAIRECGSSLETVTSEALREFPFDRLETLRSLTRDGFIDSLSFERSQE